MSTIEKALICPDPNLPRPDSQPWGPFAGITTQGLYQNPQPSRGWRPKLMSLTLTVRNSLDAYDVTLAPEWMCAWLPSSLAPASPGDMNAINAAALQQPAVHPFFFLLGAPAAEAKALVYLANNGRGYTPPLDATGRWWGLLVRATNIPIGGIVNVSPNWAVERDPGVLGDG